MSGGPVVLVDASIWIFRAHFSLPDSIVDDAGRPAAALQGWAATLLEELARAPASLGIAFDEALFTGFRHRLFPAYKADRVLPDESLAHQLAAARGLCDALGLCSAASEEYEADDLLATAASRARAAGRAVEIVSRDKDLLQSLRGPGDRMRAADGSRSFDLAGAEARFGVPTAAIPELQALSGDAIDGIPGVRGVGERTAMQLIRRHGDLEGLYAALDAEGVEALGGLRGAAGLAVRLAAAREDVFLFRELTRAREDAAVDFAPHLAPAPRPDREQAAEALASVGLAGRLRGRIARLGTS